MTTKRGTLISLLAGSGATLGIIGMGTASQHAHANPREKYFTNSEFIDHNGRKVKFYDDIVKDKLVVINMMYTVCTGICPGNTANLLAVQQALGDRVGRDVYMVSLSLRPEADTPQALRDYIKMYGIQPGWTFLTGSRPSMEQVRRKLGFYDTDPNEDALLSRHTGMVSIGNDRLNRWCMMPALTAKHQLIRSIVEMT